MASLCSQRCDKQVWTLVVRVELMFEAVDGIAHGECTLAVMNDRFVIGHVPIFLQVL